MGLYNLPEFNISFKNKKVKKGTGIILSAVFLSILFGFLGGIASSGFFYLRINDCLKGISVDPELEIIKDDVVQESQERSIINLVKRSSPAVVSIAVGEFGGGTGFIVSEDGLILTNKHVVLDEDVEYTVTTNDGKKYSAEVLAKDPFQDLAIIKIERDGEKFPILILGDSDELEIGQTVIAIGNALAEFRNTVSSGLVSGLSRRITASGGTFVETLNDVIQTDTAINKGNSGGPLLNLRGEVIGINTAIASNAQSIGFSIPINYAKRDIEQIRTIGKIVYPFIGIRYTPINETVKEDEGLGVNYGVLIINGGAGKPAISPDSPAEKAGLQERDIILSLNGKKITMDNSLVKILMAHIAGDEISMMVLRNGEELEISLILSERPE